MNMGRIAFKNSKVAKAGFATLALAVVAVPAVSAIASSVDPSAPLSAAQVDQGRQIFNDWSCGACHALADASGTGSIGPSFDGNARLDYAVASDRITNGQGAMPGFGGQMTDEEIDIVTKYIVKTKK